MKRIRDPPTPCICRCRTIIERLKTFGAKGNHSDADSRFSHNSPKSKFDNQPNRVGKYYGYDGYIRVKKIGKLG